MYEHHYSAHSHADDDDHDESYVGHDEIYGTRIGPESTYVPTHAHHHADGSGYPNADQEPPSKRPRRVRFDTDLVWALEPLERQPSGSVSGVDMSGGGAESYWGSNQDQEGGYDEEEYQQSYRDVDGEDEVYYRPESGDEYEWDGEEEGYEAQGGWDGEGEGNGEEIYVPEQGLEIDVQEEEQEREHEQSGIVDENEQWNDGTQYDQYDHDYPPAPTGDEEFYDDQEQTYPAEQVDNGYYSNEVEEEPLFLPHSADDVQGGYDDGTLYDAYDQDDMTGSGDVIYERKEGEGNIDDVGVGERVDQSGGEWDVYQGAGEIMEEVRAAEEAGDLVRDGHSATVYDYDQDGPVYDENQMDAAVYDSPSRNRPSRVIQHGPRTIAKIHTAHPSTGRPGDQHPRTVHSHGRPNATASRLSVSGPVMATATTHRAGPAQVPVAVSTATMARPTPCVKRKGILKVHKTVDNSKARGTDETRHTASVDLAGVHSGESSSSVLGQSSGASPRKRPPVFRRSQTRHQEDTQSHSPSSPSVDQPIPPDFTLSTDNATAHEDTYITPSDDEPPDTLPSYFDDDITAAPAQSTQVEPLEEATRQDVPTESSRKVNELIALSLAESHVLQPPTRRTVEGLEAVNRLDAPELDEQEEIEEQPVVVPEGDEGGRGGEEVQQRGNRVRRGVEDEEVEGGEPRENERGVSVECML